MNDNILDRYAGRGNPTDDTTAEAEQHEDLGSFGYLRGIRDRAVMIEFRFKSGDSTAFPYSALSRVDFNRSDGVALTFGGTKVHIHGQNLDAEIRPGLRLMTGILNHRVAWLSEHSQDLGSVEASAISVAQLEVE